MGSDAAVAETVGLIGLGLVGKAMIARLVPAGWTVLGWDIDSGARELAADLGAQIAEDAPAAAREVRTLLLSLPDSAVVTRALWQEGIGDALQPGATVLDTSTGTPADARSNHARLAERGVRFVDVTLSGSSEQIARGEAAAMVGAPAAEADYCDVIERFASTIFLLGEPGHGCLAKLVVNLVMGVNRAALAEGLALGERAGLDSALLLEVLRGSAAYSRVMDMKGERMVQRDYAPASRIAQHAKDVRLILELAEELGAHTPLQRAHAEVLRAAIDAGLVDADNAALIEVFRQAEERE